MCCLTSQLLPDRVYMAVLFHWVCITLVMCFSLKRVLNCHTIKLVKVEEDLQMLGLMSMASLPSTAEILKGVTFFVRSQFSIAKTPKQTKENFDCLVSMLVIPLLKTEFTVCIAHKTFLNIDEEGCLHFLVSRPRAEGK